ncbi:MAG: ABC transporter permease subunit [Gammaproteobacteria bacterium]
MKLRRFKPLFPRGRGLIIGVPYLWLLLFFLIPFIIVLKISFAVSVIDVPPYTALLQFKDDALRITLDLGNYLFLLSDDLYALAYLSSIQIAALSTLLCLLIGYPMAYAISRATPTLRSIFLMLIIIPYWTSFLIRVYAWMGILSTNGLLNDFLIHLGIVSQPLHIMYTNFAVYLGMVYAYLPFMVLPLYANLVRHDPSLLEAAHDLGAKPWKAFFTITVPLSKGGIIAGSLLVFIPAVGEFVIPELLGGPNTLMIGRVVWNEFFANHDWPTAAAVAIVMLLILLVPIILFHRYQARELERF